MSRFSRLPGITDGGGWRNYVVGFGYFVLITGIIGALPGGEDPGDTAGADDVTTAASTTTMVETQTVTTDASLTTTTEEPTAASTETPTTKTNETTTTEPTTTAVPAAPDGESYSFSGSGNEVTDSFATEGGLVVLDFEHDGSSNFQVQAVSSAGDEKNLVNDIGTYDGQVALYMPADDWQLDVTADGSWEADITQPRYNENDLESLPASGEGEHAAYFGPYQFEGTTEVTFEIENDAQASVWLATHKGEKVELLHNEIGPYEGSALVNQDGVGLIIVDTDSAEWRIKIGE